MSSGLADFPRGVGDGCMSRVQREIADLFSRYGDVLPGMSSGIIQCERLSIMRESRFQITGGREFELSYWRLNVNSIAGCIYTNRRYLRKPGWRGRWRGIRVLATSQEYESDSQECKRGDSSLSEKPTRVSAARA